MTIVPIYAALLGLFFVALSIRVIRLRRSAKAALGVNGDAELERAVRVHANFAEYAPITILLLGMLELRGANALWLHGLCLTLLIGRLAHAYGVSQRNEDFRFRVTGMALTFGALVLAALSLLGQAWI